MRFSRGCLASKDDACDLKDSCGSSSLWDKKDSSDRALSGWDERGASDRKAWRMNPRFVSLMNHTPGVDVELRARYVEHRPRP